jgi:hypothetical protein
MQSEIAKLRRRVLTPPQTQQTFEEFHPFKIYQPDTNLLATTGTTFDISGNPLSIAIDSTVPTNLPTTVNPTTDGWRIWAVRTGRVSARGSTFISYDYQLWIPGNNSITNDSDFASTFEVAGCDGIAIGNQNGLPYEFDPALVSGYQISPIVLPFNFDSFGLYSIALWVQIDMINLTAQLKATRYNTLSGYASAFPQASDGSFVPIGAITSLGYNYYQSGANPKALTAFQIQYGNAINRYGMFQNNQGNTSGDGLVFSASINYRGDFLNDVGLSSFAFYPGDVVKIQKEIDLTATSTGGITTTINTGGATNKLFPQELWMMTAVGFTSDPTTDPNWVKISGLDISTQTNRTPNT